LKSKYVSGLLEKEYSISGLNKKIEEFDHYSSKLDKFVEV